MTSYQDPSVYPCPGCSAFFLSPRYRLMHFYRKLDWSDGKPAASWRQEPLARCGACAALFWLDDIAPVGVMPVTRSKSGWIARSWLRWRGDSHGDLRNHEVQSREMRLWGDARYIGNANFDDIVHVLSRSRGLSDQQLLWLRKRIWWQLNDRYRSACDGSPLPDVPVWPRWAERNNMQAILAMLPTQAGDADQMILRGELLRLLGRFDEAIAVLKMVPPVHHSDIRARKMTLLARAGDTNVRLMSPMHWRHASRHHRAS